MTGPPEATLLPSTNDLISFTESSPISAVVSTNDAFPVGELVANCSAKIMNEDASAEVGPGERGELWIRGPNVMKGYWRNELATRKTVTEEGWLMTGDICTMDNSNFCIVDRKKVHQISSRPYSSINFVILTKPPIFIHPSSSCRTKRQFSRSLSAILVQKILTNVMQELIKIRGHQVAPAEVEALLIQHPSIQDAAVIGVLINGEEHPRAYVVPQLGHLIDTDEVVEFVKQRASRFKWITGGVMILGAIPRNASGKILRRVLREMEVEKEKSVGNELGLRAKL